MIANLQCKKRRNYKLTLHTLNFRNVTNQTMMEIYFLDGYTIISNMIKMITQ